MQEFYLTAVFMAIIVTASNWWYISSTLKIQRGVKRNLLIMLHPMLTVGFVLISSELLEKFFSKLRGNVDFTTFYLIWIVPYGLTVITLINKHKKQKTNL